MKKYLPILLLLSGCVETARLPEPGPQDCQVRGGAALTEGTASASGIGGIQADVRGGAYTRVGKCNEKDFVFARTANGFACHGTEEWCNNAMDNTPISVSPSQLREILNEEQSP